jgi:glycosyltransferase involved in cell wall biosynthesis
MKKIEIILIDDNSTDNSLNIIKKYMQEDQRIRLIKNNKNRKIFKNKHNFS